MRAKGTLIRLNTKTGETQTYKVDMLAPEGTEKRLKPVGDSEKETEDNKNIIAENEERLREKP
jgi:hypothetical protein